MIKLSHQQNQYKLIIYKLVFILFFSISTFSQSIIYSEDFSAGAGGWTTTSTGNGTGAWVNGSDPAYSTGATGNYFYSQLYGGRYNNRTFITATSPAINLTGFVNIALDLDIWYNTESLWDGMKIEYSLNNGATWADLGTIANTNWYNDTDVDAFNNGEDGWSNNSGGWVNKSIDLSTENSAFETASQVKFRVLFASDGSVTDVGVAFDEIVIQGFGPNDCGTVEIHTADFETNLDGWTDGGWDAARVNNATRAYSGNFSLQIRDNSGAQSSFVSPTFNILPYNKVDFSFFFYTISMEAGENFFIEYRDNTAAAWTVVGDFRAGDINFTTHTGDFQRGSPALFYAKTVTINSDTQVFSSTGQFRVRCDASDNSDNIYIDKITIEGARYCPITEAPGGVTNNLELWLKADYVDGVGVVTDNTSLNEWVDSGKGHNAKTNVVAQAPLYKNNTTDNINFNPVVDFNNSSAASNPDMQYLGTHAGANQELKGTGGFYTHDIFVVAIPDQAITTALIPLDTFTSTDPLGSTFTEDVTGFGYGAYTQRFANELLTYCIGHSSAGGNGYGRADTGVSGIDFNQVGIINLSQNSANNGEDLYFNANNVGDSENDPARFANISNTRFWLGRSQKWSGSFGGRIAEVITYSSRKTDASLTEERNRIQSYLAIKYGITLGVNGTSQDYVDSAGTIVWDANTGVAVNDVFNFDITGIARDDASELNQKQSKSINSLSAPTTANDITIGLTDISTTNSANANTFANDRSYLVWGNDDGNLNPAATTVVDMSFGIAGLNTEVRFQSFNRKWKVVESGTMGKVKISLPSAMITPTLPTPGDYLMFISSTPTFSPTADYRVMTVNGSNFETTYDFTGTKYITFGYAPEEKFDRSIYFDGVDDYLDAENVLDLDPASFTVSAWIKRDVGVVNADIVSKRDFPFTEGYSLMIGATGNSTMEWKNNVGVSQTISSSVNIPENQWHHIAVTFDGTNAKMYLDGVLDTTIGLDPPATSTQNFMISATNHNTPTRFFKGNIDEVRVWNTTLTEDQLHYIMNQEIMNNGGSVKGSYFQNGLIDPLRTTPALGTVTTPIGTPVTLSKNISIPWANLQAYYPMSRYTFTNAKDESTNSYTATLKNLTTVDYQTAPLPYKSSNNGTWSTSGTWENGNIQTLPGDVSIVDNTKTIDWNIVETNHNITMSNSSLPTSALGVDNRKLLALIVKSGEITVNGDNTSGTGNGLTISHYLKLDGVIDLEGESQLIQTDQSDLAVNSAGHIEKDQQGTANCFTYNYWSAPVSLIGTVTNNTPYKIIDVLKDGTNTATPITPNFEAGTTQTTVSPFYADGALTSPRKIGKYWFWKFVNTGNAYANWAWAGNATMNVTEGYTMKGVSGASAITDTQNYTFIGKPNNVLNGDAEIIHTTFGVPAPDPFISLTGNPFPSAIDADKFINDNKVTTGTGAIDGSIYFWEHFGGGSHNLSDYQGGYAIRNLTTGVAATSHPSIDQGGVAAKGAPGQYIPPGQGFFVISSATGGNVVFKNSQRVFQKESAGISVFYRDASEVIRNTTQRIENEKMIIRLGFKSPDGYHRQLAVGFNIEGATEGFDLGYDATNGDKLSNDAFFTLGDKYLVIQAFDNFDILREIPLSIIIDEDNNLGLETFMVDGLENVPEDLEIYIRDNTTGETYDIKNQNYEVNLTSGEHKTRFSLVFLPLMSDVLTVEEPDLSENGVNVFVNNESTSLNIKKTSEVTINKVMLYNYLGQKIQTWTDNLSNDNLNLPINKISTGAYILKIETNKNNLSKKIIIKN